MLSFCLHPPKVRHSSSRSRRRRCCRQAHRSSLGGPDRQLPVTAHRDLRRYICVCSRLLWWRWWWWWWWRGLGPCQSWRRRRCFCHLSQTSSSWSSYFCTTLLLVILLRLEDARTSSIINWRFDKRYSVINRYIVVRFLSCVWYSSSFGLSNWSKSDNFFTQHDWTLTDRT